MKTFTLLIAILFAVGLNTSQAQGTWKQKKNFGGTARYGAPGFSIGSKGYIGTGYASGTVAQKDFWEYDPVSNIWTQKADFGGEARFFAAGFSIGNKGYIGTGENYGATTMYKDFWEYDPATNAWTQKKDFGGEGRFTAVGFSIGSKGYIGTGNSKYTTVFKDFWEYDPGTDTWTQKADFGGAARWAAVGLSISNKGYIGTGANNDQSVYYRDFWEYDPGIDTWTQKANYKGAGGAGGTGFSLGSKGYIGTGLAKEIRFKDFWEYDPETDTWTQKVDFGGGARGGEVAFSIGNKGYVGTGNDDFGMIYKDFWEYTPDCYQNITVYADADGDGYGNVNKSKVNPTCDVLAGYVLDSTDCNDTNAAINPGVSEIPSDGIDNNCNGLVDEKINNALSFDGVDDYVNMPPLTFGGAVTFEAWVYVDKHQSWQRIIDIGNGSFNNNIVIGFFENSGRLYSESYQGSTTVKLITDEVLPTEQWIHVAVVNDGQGHGFIYWNGVLKASGNLLTPFNVTRNTAYLGRSNWSGDAYFSGKQDEVRIWNTVRTQAEIQADMLGGTCGDQNGLVAAYSFNQGIAGGNNGGVTTLNDITANHNNGTLTNFALTGATSNWVNGVPGLSDSTLVFKDADNDKYGNAAKSIKVPVCTIPNGYVLDNGDCNDTNASIHPNAIETFNGIDDNCNGLIDEITGLSTTNITATTVTFNWSPLPGTERYIVRYKPVDTTGGTSWVRIGVGFPAISVTVAGLVPNTKYKWVIKSVYDSVHTDFSGPVKFKTAAALAINQQNKSSVKATVKEFVVYPNPTTGNVTINLTLAKKQSLFIKVFDVTGKEVYSSGEGMVSGPFSRQTDLSKLNPGTYFLKVVHDRETEVKAIVLKK